MESKIHETNAGKLAKQYRKSNFKIVGKKSVLFFLLIAFVAFASSQTLITDKQKTSVQKDTVKKSKTLR